MQPGRNLRTIHGQNGNPENEGDGPRSAGKDLARVLSVETAARQEPRRMGEVLELNGEVLPDLPIPPM